MVFLLSNACSSSRAFLLGVAAVVLLASLSSLVVATPMPDPSIINAVDTKRNFHIDPFELRKKGLETRHDMISSLSKSTGHSANAQDLSTLPSRDLASNGIINSESLLTEQIDTQDLQDAQTGLATLIRAMQIPGKDRSVFAGRGEYEKPAREFASKLNKVFFYDAWDSKLLRLFIQGTEKEQGAAKILLATLFIVKASGAFYIVGNAIPTKQNQEERLLYRTFLMPDLKKNPNVMTIIFIDPSDFKETVAWKKTVTAQNPTLASSEASKDLDTTYSPTMGGSENGSASDHKTAVSTSGTGQRISANTTEEEDETDTNLITRRD